MKEGMAGSKLIQLRFEHGARAPHSRRMLEGNENPRGELVAAVFCAIVALIAYASYLH